MAVQAVIAVSPKVFLLVWWAIHLSHVLCVLYAIGIISVHRYVIAQNLQVIVDYLGPDAFGFFQPVIATKSVVVACHLVEALRTVVCSAHAREFRFTKRSSTPNATHPEPLGPTGLEGPSIASMVAVVPMDSRFQRARQIRNSLGTHFQAFRSRFQSLSIAGANYDLVFFCFETIEIFLQTYQAHKLSGLVSAVWINRLYALVLTFNCWSTAFVHNIIHSNQLVKRVLLVVMDSVFDMTTNMAIPFAIFLPYYREFDLDLRDFPMDNYYHDVWLIQAISENQQVFVTSWLDFVSKMVPDLFFLFSIVVLKQTVVVDTISHTKDDVMSLRRSGKSSSSCTICSGSKQGCLRAIVPTVKTRIQISGALQRISHATSKGIRNLRNSSARLSSDQRLAIRKELFAIRKHVWHDRFLVLFGFTILSIHIHTTFVAVSAAGHGCMLAMRPWLTTQPTCASLEINCARGQHNNGADVESLGVVFTQVDPQSLKALVLSGCSNLHMPPAIQLLPALQMIKIYNSTIDRWDTTAELRDDHNPSLLFIYVCDSNFSDVGELPVGMLGNRIPRQFVDAEFSGTNLVRLPADLHEKWPSIMYFVLERSPGIVEFPDTIVKMNIPQLMLGSNSIESIPPNLLADQAFWKLMLDGNPLKELPNTIGDIRDLYRVGFAFTAVTALPEWATASALDSAQPFLGFVDLVAGGTPLCLSAATLGSVTETAESWVVLSCSPDAPMHAYPFEREREWRAASQAKWF